MLEIVDVVKDYFVDKKAFRALKGINLFFPKQQFCSILGPSGCGKTTTLNIIGGLDQYTSGDLIIEGQSTKIYNDKDWDNYRNKRVGFVFQSYNLIPQLNLQDNVAMALTLNGVSRKERIERARIALDKVGLNGLYNKKFEPKFLSFAFLIAAIVPAFYKIFNIFHSYSTKQENALFS